jgi:hypothetical protein
VVPRRPPFVTDEAGALSYPSKEGR